MNVLILPLLCVLLFTSFDYEAQACSSKGITCITSTSYQFCFEFNGADTLYGDVTNCTDGTVCSEDTGSTACITDTSSTTSTTESSTASTTTESTTQSTTSSTTESTTTPTTTSTTTETTTQSTTPTTTESTTTASTTTSTTTASTTTSTTQSTTTTESTTSTTEGVTQPTCTTEGNYAAAECNQYYKCLLVLWNYYTLLKECPTGQAFNSTSAACEDSTTCTTTT